VLCEWGGKSKDGRDEFKAKRPGWDAPIHQLCAKHKGSAVFHGHDHFYAHQELDDVAHVMGRNRGTRAATGCETWTNTATCAASSNRPPDTSASA